MADKVYLRMQVKRVIIEGLAGVTLELDGSLACQAGQFVMVWVPGVEERPFTLMNDDPVCLAVADVGPLTHALCTLTPGDSVWLRGPYGRGFELGSSRLLLLGGGSGIASLALLARRATLAGNSVRVAIGARTADYIMLEWYLLDQSSSIIVATDDGSRGFKGNVLQAARGWFAWATAIYACGPEKMLQSLADSLTPDDPPCWVNLERVMRCGIGVCGSCHCGPQLVCLDGPVFKAQILLNDIS
jgi:dihydroorotate dehydrogenase electron transfer subunit